ncbi:MAG: AAA family ATPase [Candidatus Dojkabacteria bacterium]|nr:AAA family ATPase [Candidatus Dojkabacteria bacterium]
MKEKIENYLWVEKYRPKTIEDFVWNDETLKENVYKWIKNKQIPNLLLTGTPGTGKTSLALLLFKELNIDKNDILFINASSNRGIDTIRDIIINFASTMPMGNFKYILLDEADSLTQTAQLSLRNVIESYVSICRFILTGNYSNKIIPPLKSRFQHFNFKSLDKEYCIKRAAEILLNEGAKLDENLITNISEYVNKFWPDLRKIINNLQKNWDGKTLKNIKNEQENEEFFRIFYCFKNKKIEEGRNLIGNLLSENDYVIFFRFIYNNLEKLGFNSFEKKAMALVLLLEGMKNHSIVADPEINLSAILVQMIQALDN